MIPKTMLMQRSFQQFHEEKNIKIPQRIMGRIVRTVIQDNVIHSIFLFFLSSFLTSGIKDIHIPNIIPYIKMIPVVNQGKNVSMCVPFTCSSHIAPIRQQIRSRNHMINHAKVVEMFDNFFLARNTPAEPKSIAAANVSSV